jgi:membrane fusion protein, multidrug efflux system
MCQQKKNNLLTHRKYLNMKSTIYKALLIIAAAVVFSACGSSDAGDKDSQLQKLKAEQASLAKQIATLEKEMSSSTSSDTIAVRAKEVTATEIVTKPFNHYIQTQGKVEAEDNILVSAKSMGVITQVYVKEGQIVARGQVLAQIDNTVMVRSIESMKAQMDFATTVYERQKNLWDQKIGTEVQFLQAKTNKESLEKQLASLTEQNEMTKIKAPVNGTVDDVFVKVGENIAPGMPAARVVNTNNLTLKANVSESYVTNVKTGNKVIVSIPELKKDIEARVTFVGKTIDPLSRTFVVEIKLPSYADLRPNMSGVVKVVYYSETAALTVPVNVVQTVNDQKIVFVAEADGKSVVARKRVVEVVGVFDNLAHIRKGVVPGDKVITFGYQGLSDGQVIKL